MSGSYVNVRKTYDTTGAKEAIQLNRWAKEQFAAFFKVGTTATATLQGTLDYINRNTGIAPVWFDINDASTTDTIAVNNVEAVRLNITALDSDITLHIMQNAD